MKYVSISSWYSSVGLIRFRIEIFIELKMSEVFKIHIGELLKSSDFSDVTIVSDDQKIFKGHRNILSGFSPVLKKLFKVDSQYHPALLYLNGINSSEINAIMEFIYCNTIPKTWTEQLKSAVISLEIKGLLEHIPVTQSNLPSLSEIEIGKTIPVERIKEENYGTEAKDFIQKAFKTEVIDSNVSGMCIANGSHVKVRLSDLVEMRAQYSPKESQSHKKIRTFSKPNLIDSNPSIKESKQHTNKKHLVITDDTQCDQCDYNPRDRRNLIKHKKAVHEGLRFPCNFCEYKSTCRTGLKNHISSIHEGIKHQCHQCGKQFSQSRILNRHIREFHEGIRMKVKCEFCEYHATKRENLLVHFQKMHKDIPIEIFREKMKSSSRHRGPRKPTEQLPSSNSTPNSISTPTKLDLHSKSIQLL